MRLINADSLKELYEGFGEYEDSLVVPIAVILQNIDDMPTIATINESARCDGCKYEYKRGDESPCTECCNNYMSKWERRPKKTRQDEFLEMYPNAIRDKSTDVIMVCPKDISGEIPYNFGRKCDISCVECCQDYWSQEVEK